MRAPPSRCLPACAASYHLPSRSARSIQPLRSCTRLHRKLNHQCCVRGAGLAAFMQQTSRVYAAFDTQRRNSVTLSYSQARASLTSSDGRSLLLWPCNASSLLSSSRYGRHVGSASLKRVTASRSSKPEDFGISAR